MPDPHDPSNALTIDQLVRLRAAEHGDKPMVIDPAARITYRELDTDDKRFGGDLHRSRRG